MKDEVLIDSIKINARCPACGNTWGIKFNSLSEFNERQDDSFCYYCQDQNLHRGENDNDKQRKAGILRQII